MEVSLAGWSFLGYALILGPYSSIRSAQRLRDLSKLPPKPQLLASVLSSQIFTTVLAVAVAWAERIDLWAAPKFDGISFVLVIGFLIAAVGTLPLRWRTRSLEDRRRMLWRLPAKPSEFWGWALISFGAGVSEEIAFRGVVFILLQRLLAGAWWLPALIGAAAFALCHYLQGFRSMAIIFAIALAMQGIVLASGSLFVAMALHFLYDVAAGIVYFRLARRDGLIAAASESP